MSTRGIQPLLTAYHDAQICTLLSGGFLFIRCPSQVFHLKSTIVKNREPLLDTLGNQTIGACWKVEQREIPAPRPLDAHPTFRPQKSSELRKEKKTPNKKKRKGSLKAGR